MQLPEMVCTVIESPLKVCFAVNSAVTHALNLGAHFFAVYNEADEESKLTILVPV